MNINWLIDKRVGMLESPENPTLSQSVIEDLVREGFHVVITVADYDYCLSWKIGSGITLRHYQLSLGNCPELSDWELQSLNEYLLYEIHQDRNVVIWCKSGQASQSIHNSVAGFFNHKNMTLEEFVKSKLASQPERAKHIPLELTRCQGCQEKKCITDLVCHVTSVADAERILESGVILSAVRARNKSREELVRETRNAAGDPPDYFEYIMFTFGNCIAGDRLVMERALGRGPSQEELTEEFLPGVRFYFRYHDLVNHPGFCSDGYHLVKIKDRLELSPYLIAAVASKTASVLAKAASPEISRRLIFISSSPDNDLLSLSSQAYRIVKEYERNGLR